MKGYSRITKNTARSKSVDFSDPSFSSNFSKFKSQKTEPNISNAGKITTMQRSIPEDDNNKDNGKVFRIIFSQKSIPHSGASDQRMIAAEEGAPSKFQTVVKKTASIKRSSSVSEGYSRIYHQCGLAAGEDDQNGTEFTTQYRHKKKKGKFLEACRRLFGLQI